MLLFNVLFFIFLVIHPVVSSEIEITGYSCDFSQQPYKSISMNNMKTCVPPQKHSTSKTIFARVLYTPKLLDIVTPRCKISIVAKVTGCGMNSYGYPVDYGMQNYVQNISSSECQQIIKTGSFTIGSHKLTNIKLNELYTASINYANNHDQSCSDGNIFSLNGKLYKDAYADMGVTIEVVTSKIQYDIIEKSIILPDGYMCMIDDFKCTDSTSNTYVIPVVTGDHCINQGSHVYYEGLVNSTTYTKNNEEITYVSWTLGTGLYYTGLVYFDTYCKFWITKVENIYIVYDIDENDIQYGKSALKVVKDNQIPYKNLDTIFQDTRLTVGEVNVDQIYNHIQYEDCLKVTKKYQNIFDQAKSNYIVNAYDIMSEEGYFALVSGEVLHLFKCKPLTVHLRATDKCYKDIPVAHDNEEKYVQLRNRLILDKSDELPCDEHFLPAIQVNQLWYTYYEKIHLIHNPIELDPNQDIKEEQATQLTVKYKPKDSKLLNALMHQYIHDTKSHNMRMSNSQADTNQIENDYDQILEENTLGSYIGIAMDKISNWWEDVHIIPKSVTYLLIVIGILYGLSKVSYIIKVCNSLKKKSPKNVECVPEKLYHEPSNNSQQDSSVSRARPSTINSRKVTVVKKL